MTNSTAIGGFAPAELLPDGLAAKVETACGATILSVQPQGGGGASRQGAELLLGYPGGRERHAYINYDTMKSGAADDADVLREGAVLRALSGPLRDLGVRAAGFIAAIPECRALICDFVAGNSNFGSVKSPVDRQAIAYDFMAQLATLHSLDPSERPIAGFDDAREPARAVRESIQKLRTRHLAAGPHPLILLTLDWLERNVPADPHRIVVVHGDPGPGNFLFAGKRVTALLDWELVHYGDAMEDLAMLCIRNLFQPFIHLPDAFAAYESAGGVKVDLARVRYYRLFFQVRWASRLSRINDPKAAPPVYGTSLVYATTHMRVLNQALAEAAGIPLPPIDIPEQPPGAHRRSFDVALADLRDFIVARLTDQQAVAKAKGLARLVKWWRDIERFGPAFDVIERTEYSRVLNRPFASAAAARAALCQSILEGTLDQAMAIRLCHYTTSLDGALLADAMGAFASTRFAPLE